MAIALTEAPPTSNDANAVRAESASDAGETPTATVHRVGGDMAAKAEWRDGTWTFAPDERTRMTIEAPLPEGYPAPTPPGAIEIKTYPSVRRAEYTGRGNAELGMNFGFWPLFQHIQRNSIAMTSPVEMDYTGWSGRSEEISGALFGSEWTMSFLYRSADLGPIGEDGSVTIVDTEPITVIAMGIRGPYGRRTIAPALETIMDWLANQPTPTDGSPQWEIAGDPRAFYYNGPSVRNMNKWGEAQIPVRRKQTVSE